MERMEGGRKGRGGEVGRKGEERGGKRREGEGREGGLTPHFSLPSAAPAYNKNREGEESGKTVMNS